MFIYKEIYQITKAFIYKARVAVMHRWIMRVQSGSKPCPHLSDRCLDATWPSEFSSDGHALIPAIGLEPIQSCPQ